MLCILLIQLEKIIPFQAKRKRVMGYFLYLVPLLHISSEAAHFPEKLIRKKTDQVRPKNICLNPDNTSICYKSE